MPASRRARAMIFAPRSWPSRPGLATTTRITSEDGCFGVGAVHALQRFDDLALGAVGAGAVEQRFHQVAARRGAVAQLGERLLRGVGVAARPHRLHAADLLALQLGRDPEDLEPLFVVLLVAVYADHDPLAAFDLLLQRERSVGDLALGVVLLDRGDHPAQ